jgi:uncharacterized protein with HEPN domain
MNARDKKVALKIIEHIDDALEFNAYESYDSFMSNKQVKMATAFAIAQIGELTALLSEGFKNELKGVDWRGIKGFRNWVVHRYEKVDLPAFWDIVTIDLPRLKSDLAKVLNLDEQDAQEINRVVESSIKVRTYRYPKRNSETKKHQDIYGMSRIGYTNDSYEIYVNTDDGGNIPHFHYRDPNNWQRFHTCICIETAEYFHHGNEQDILNHRQKRQLSDFMNRSVSIHRYSGSFKNNWDLICFLWDINNSNISVSDTTELPDYNQL